MTRKPISKKNETKLQIVVEAFENSPASKTAVNFGRKLLKVEQGIRATYPPQYDLSDAQVKRIHKLLEIPVPAKSKKVAVAA